MSSYRVRDVADEAELMTSADHLGTKFGEPAMRDGASLEVADVVGRVVHALHVSDARADALPPAAQASPRESRPLTSATIAGSPA
jgi:hypothetical protein